MVLPHLLTPSPTFCISRSTLSLTLATEAHQGRGRKRGCREEVKGQGKEGKPPPQLPFLGETSTVTHRGAPEANSTLGGRFTPASPWEGKK